MKPYPSVGRKKCDRRNCRESFAPHRWGYIWAQRSGWFFQSDGKLFCPDHIPERVAKWRENREAA